jgi:hypothetical protein
VWAYDAKRVDSGYLGQMLRMLRMVTTIVTLNRAKNPINMPMLRLLRLKPIPGGKTHPHRRTPERKPPCGKSILRAAMSRAGTTGLNFMTWRYSGVDIGSTCAELILPSNLNGARPA